MMLCVGKTIRAGLKPAPWNNATGMAVAFK